ncbi:DUF1465 family protein [Inquilinus sp. CAU 1745]|uniref:DUF1465 family protein n=1 Tax=Inquilinus sp. CAU 1745 TaxID=3140369 RepID=UPI00325AF2F7
MTELVATTAFFNKTYEEALGLLIEARNYIAYQEAADMRDLSSDLRLIVSQENMRVTCRLTQVMAWMLCQRAVQTGEMTRERALSDEFAIGGEEVCMDETWSARSDLPAAVASLLDRSLRLYVRVRRLDEMLRRATG